MASQTWINIGLQWLGAGWVPSHSLNQCQHIVIGPWNFNEIWLKKNTKFFFLANTTENVVLATWETYLQSSVLNVLKDDIMTK